MQSPNDVIKKNEKILNTEQTTEQKRANNSCRNTKNNTQGPLLPVEEDRGNEVGNKQSYFHTFLFTSIKRSKKRKGIILIDATR